MAFTSKAAPTTACRATSSALRDGTAPLGNTGAGVEIYNAQRNLVGGTTSLLRNVIAGNGGNGVEIGTGGGSVPPSSQNTVQGNFIGTNAQGSAPVANTGNGVLIEDAFQNTIGGTTSGAANVISDNTGNGVAVTGNTSIGNGIEANSIFNNGKLGIDLVGASDPANGVTPNDNADPSATPAVPPDTDAGPNNLQNFPVLDPVSGNTVMGTLNSTPSTQFRIEFFASDAADPSGNGEGQTFLGFVNATTGADGNATFSFTSPSAIGGKFISATASDPTGNTSEFSPTQQAALPPTLGLVIRPGIIEENSTRPVMGVVTRNTAPSGTLVVTLTNDNPAKIRIPATVTIPDGQTLAAFPVTIINNKGADGTIRVKVTARASGYTGASSGLTVIDDEARLLLTVQPDVFFENAAPGTITGTLRRNTPTTAALAVRLASSDTRKVTVPLIVTIPAGKASVNFAVRVTDNSVADGPQRVKIVSRAAGFPTAIARVTVLDNEAALTLSINPPTFSKSAGGHAALATVTRNTPTTLPLNVVVTSSDPNTVKVPKSVTIPAGQALLSFPLTAVDDGRKDASRVVTITVAAPNDGFTPASRQVTVTGD